MVKYMGVEVGDAPSEQPKEPDYNLIIVGVVIAVLVVGFFVYKTLPTNDPAENMRQIELAEYHELQERLSNEQNPSRRKMLENDIKWLQRKNPDF